MVKKYIKATINTTLYLKEHLKFACGHGGGGWSEGLQTVSPGSGRRMLSEVRCEVNKCEWV